MSEPQHDAPKQGFGRMTDRMCRKTSLPLEGLTAAGAPPHTPGPEASKTSGQETIPLPRKE